MDNFRQEELDVARPGERTNTMNMEIWFRGKRLNGDKSWIFGNLVQYGWNPSIWSSELKDDVKVDLATIGRYTGLTDRNGKRIFEGDILLRRKEMCLVEYKKAEFYLRFFRDPHICLRHGLLDSMVEDRGDDLEVIGNIHDNPELLESL